MNNLFYDNRKNLDALDGMVLLYPLPESPDINGDDLNKVPNMTLLSFASRLKFGISGPDAFGAKTSGLLEFDFTARANCATLRFRQGWVKFNWEKTELLVGRAWHPLASMDVLPGIAALSMGAPFQPFNRSDQITITHKMGNLNLILSASYQNDYNNSGPSGKVFTYQNNSLIPNLHAQIKYKSENTVLGLGIDYKRLMPRSYVESPIDKSRTKTREALDCGAILAYGQVKPGKFTIGGKAILAANTSESLMLGGYGISSFDTVSGYEQYSNFRHLFLWGNISYGAKLKGSLFGGYLKNLGTGKDLIAPFINAPNTFGLGESIDRFIRITPTISYTSGKSVIAFEVEQNIAWMGTIDYGDRGNIINSKSISGTRLLLSLMYNF
ncbi:MAG TPA: hypothetical protein VK179_08775 [Bacteroidales bacterium]|nr:hypothetical protein [Bacteroidales bacterium]